MNPRYDSPGRFSLSPGRASNGRSPLTPTEKADRCAAAALSAKVSWDSAGTPPPLEGLRLPQRLFAGRDDDDDGSEERFDGQPAAVAAAAGRGGFGEGEDGAEDDGEVFVPDGGGGADVGRAGDGGSVAAAGAWSLDIGCEEQQEEEEEERVGRESTAGCRLDDGDSDGDGDENPRAKAERLSVVSIVGPGTLSDEEEEEEASFMTDLDLGEQSDVGRSAGQSGGYLCPPSPARGAVVSAPAPASAVPAQEEAGPQQGAGGVVEPETAMTAGGIPPADDGDDAGNDAEQDSVLMNEIARMDEESILLEAEGELMAVTIDSDDDDYDEDDDDDRNEADEVAAQEGQKVLEPEGANPVAAAAGGGSRLSLDDSGYAPDVEETTPSLAGVVDGDHEDKTGTISGNRGGVISGDDSGDDRHAAATAAPTSSTDGRGGNADADATDDDDGADNSGYAPSEDEEEGEGGGSSHWGQSAAAAADSAAAATAAVVDNAVRETLENLAAGVAILVGDEQFLSCSEVLSELQSDAGDGGSKTAEDANRGGMEEQEEEDEQEEDTPSLVDGEVGEESTGESKSLRPARRFGSVRCGSGEKKRKRGD